MIVVGITICRAYSYSFKAYHTVLTVRIDNCTYYGEFSHVRNRVTQTLINNITAYIYNTPVIQHHKGGITIKKYHVLT